MSLFFFPLLSGWWWWQRRRRWRWLCAVAACAFGGALCIPDAGLGRSYFSSDIDLRSCTPPYLHVRSRLSPVMSLGLRLCCRLCLGCPRNVVGFRLSKASQGRKRYWSCTWCQYSSVFYGSRLRICQRFLQRSKQWPITPEGKIPVKCLGNQMCLRNS